MSTRPSGMVSSTLLEKIDKLFACGVGEYVALPQLVVVGDQSSGKSSVLEGLTGLPFPRDSTLCTRFATQITFQRCPERGISASIIPADNSAQDYRDKVKEWSKTGLGDLNPTSFAEIMKEVTDVMEIGASDAEGKPKTFSKDILHLDIAGPNEEQYSVIDVPGIFRRITQGVTTTADISLVDLMVKGYMSNPRSVILAVVPSNVDVATQEILQRAEDLDPDGIRTLGVLTKPDLVDKGAEAPIVDMVQGKKHILQLGWHLLKNPGHDELERTSKSRNDLEKDFFDTAKPWNQLEDEKVGIDSFRTRLRDILADHIRREFPKVKAELNSKLRSAQEQLHVLGPKRQTHLELNVYMTGIASQFQNMVGLATRSNYNLSDVFDHDNCLRLATLAVSRGETFANDIVSSGHVYQFESVQGPKYSNAHESKRIDSKSKPIATRYQKDHPDIDDMTAEYVMHVDPVVQPGIMMWLHGVYRKSRGFELGTFDTSLLAVTLRHQAQKWEAFAFGYVSDVITLVHNFILRLLEHVTANDRVKNRVKEILLDKLREKYRAALEHAKFLIRVELEGTPATLNKYFNDALEKCRQERLREQLKDKAYEHVNYGQVVRLEDLVQNHPLSNASHLVREIHDILQSYYELALDRFVDNVRMQVCDYFLITGSDTPIALFSPNFVAGMSPDQLEEVAGEDPRVKTKRASLEKIIEQLEGGKKILSPG